MNTKVIKLDPVFPDRDKLEEAAQILRKGGLVAFPTETVYGLGANALNEEAVKRIFLAKGRPSDNPLIMHIPDAGWVERFTTDVPVQAQRMMEAFWPGPLTIVMHKAAVVPSVITAGLDTVAIRMPSHPVALELIRLAGVPVAAPSANTSGKPSPTTAQHVIDDLMGKVDVILDAGGCYVGLESTVVDATIEPPMILRPGGITPEDLQRELGSLAVDPAMGKKLAEDITPRAPGMKYTHYSPKAEVLIVEGTLDHIVEEIHRRLAVYEAEGKKVGILATDQTCGRYGGAQVISAGNRYQPETIAQNLFAALREFDDRGVDIILAEAVEAKGIGWAVMNRMIKAAGYHIIHCG